MKTTIEVNDMVMLLEYGMVAAVQRIAKNVLFVHDNIENKIFAVRTENVIKIYTLKEILGGDNESKIL